MNCDRCIHAGVCINEPESRKIEQTVVNNMPNVMPENLRWGLICKNFRMRYTKKEKTEK